MSQLGLFVARLFGKKLPRFADQAEAEKHLFRQRDNSLRRVHTLATRSGGAFVADLTPESLKSLERWYFDLCDADDFGTIGTSRLELEECMAFYLGAVAVKNCADARWVVEEYAFEAGKYEIGVTHGRFTCMAGPMTDHFKRPGNKRRKAIYRDYQRMFSA